MTERQQGRPAARRGNPDGARKAELLDKLLAYSAKHGLSDTALRPLAAAVGSSPRVLLYFFGSKDELVREVHQHARRQQLDLLRRTLDESSPVDAVAALWEWLADPVHAGVEKFFFEGYARSLHEAEANPWNGFGAASVDAWLPHLEEALGDRGNATLVLAALRGLLLDLLATSDRPRVDAAVADLVKSLKA